MIEIKRLKEARIEYLDEVLKLSKEAEEYIESFQWCKKVVKGWLSKDWGYMVCLFYFEIIPDAQKHAEICMGSCGKYPFSLHRYTKCSKCL